MSDFRLMLKSEEKQAKLAEAMRANLAKRKQQMRARQADGLVNKEQTPTEKKEK